MNPKYKINEKVFFMKEFDNSSVDEWPKFGRITSIHLHELYIKYEIFSLTSQFIFLVKEESIFKTKEELKDHIKNILDKILTNSLNNLKSDSL